jgi:hypothetical protein
MEQREVNREAQRLPIIVGEPQPTDLHLASSHDVWGNSEYVVHWIEPVRNIKPVLPPGMDKLPEPGEAVISPALDQLASQDPSLAARYPDHSVLSTEGIRSADELLAYVRVQENRTLAESKLAVRVRGFGTPSDDEHPNTSAILGILKLELITPATIVGTLGLLVVPGLIVLVAGVSTNPSLTTSSFERGRHAGTSELSLASLAVFKTLVIALPSLLLTTVFGDYCRRA